MDLDASRGGVGALRGMAAAGGRPGKSSLEADAVHKRAVIAEKE